MRHRANAAVVSLQAALTELLVAVLLIVGSGIDNGLMIAGLMIGLSLIHVLHPFRTADRRHLRQSL